MTWWAHWGISKNIFPRPLFIIIFRPEMLKFHSYAILTRDTRVEFVIYRVLRSSGEWFGTIFSYLQNSCFQAKLETGFMTAEHWLSLYWYTHQLYNALNYMFIWCQFQLANDGPESVCVKDILLELRNYRMGLIQTVDQLKFSYMAIVEGKDNIFCLQNLISWSY